MVKVIHRGIRSRGSNQLIQCQEMVAQPRDEYKDIAYHLTLQFWERATSLRIDQLVLSATTTRPQTGPTYNNSRQGSNGQRVIWQARQVMDPEVISSEWNLQTQFLLEGRCRLGMTWASTYHLILFQILFFINPRDIALQQHLWVYPSSVTIHSIELKWLFMLPSFLQLSLSTKRYRVDWTRWLAR